MNAVSTSIEGTSGEVSTMRLACCTSLFLSWPTVSSSASTRAAASRLALMAAFCDRSSSTEASTSLLSCSDTPPIRSAAFSRSASVFAASLLARRVEST